VTDVAIRPTMRKFDIPGMAVGITAGGQTYVFDYGVASRQTRIPVTRSTLFEIGSMSKTLTATLASYAAVNGQLSLSDKTATYLPSLRGTDFGNATLLSLGTHTPGGIPLQVPADITNTDQLMKYFAQWRPAYAPGTYRTYSNVGIGTLGLITAKSMHQDFIALMQQRLFPALGMNSTYIDIPQTELRNYAQGYTENDGPIRMKAGVLYAEAYGVRTTAADMIRFLEENMHMIQLNKKLQRAITATHTGYFLAGPMTQDLIWEQYPYPVTLQALLRGNSTTMILDATPVRRIAPPQAPRNDVLINKTGTTNGFAGYMAFIPGKRLGIVILANKSYPIDDRVRIAYRILTALATGS
jgi:beta-lactamase class C